MALLTPCIGGPGDPCGKPAPPGGCEKHRAEREARHHNPQYDDPRYRAFRAEILREHRAKFGDWCPGDGDDHPGHAEHDLTLDHPRPLVMQGALFDRSNARVLCRSRNSFLGQQISSGHAPTPPAPAPAQRPAIAEPMDSITLAMRSTSSSGSR